MQSWQSAPVIGQAPAPQAQANPAPQQTPPQPRRIYGAPAAPERPKTPTPPGPQDTWRTLSPEEVQQRGLEPGGVYQISGAGAIKTVQAPPKTTAAPPSPQAGRERLARIRTSLDNLRGLERLVSSSDMGTGSIVGQESFRAGEDFAGLSGFFNQRANDVAGSIEMVQGDLINQVRQEMEMSGTPIGVKGADTEKEASRLAASIANLAQTQDEGEFLVGLGRAREYYIRRLAASINQLREAGEQVDPNEFLQSALEGGASKEELKLLASGLNLTVDEDALDANLRLRDQGSPTGSFFTPPQPPSGGGGNTVQDLGTSIPNTAIGYAQGAVEAAIDLPLDVASSVQTGANALLDTVIGGGLDLAGFPNAADAFRRTGQAEEAIRSGRARAGDVIGNALPAPQGFETQRDVARFAGGFLVPGAPAARGPQAVQQATQRTIRNAAAPSVAPNEAAQIVSEGARRGVRVMTTDVRPPQGAMERMVKQTIPEKIPFAGMSGPRQAQQVERQNAVRQIVEEFGGDTGRALFDDTVSAAEEVSKILTQQRAQRLSNLKTAKNSVIDGVQGTVSTPRAVAAIDKEIAALSKLEASEVAPVLAKLQNWKSALMGETQRIDTGLLDASGSPIVREIPPERTLRVIEDLRSLMGESFKDPNLAAVRTIGEKALNRIYGPLREDMGSFIEAQAGTAARAKWARANEELAAMVGELKSARFRNVLRDADTSPETVGRILFSGTADVSDMRRLVSNLDQNGLRKVQGAILARAFDNAGGAEGVSVERFLGNLNRFKEQIGVAFTGEDRAALEGVRRLLEATRRAAEAGANIRTGEQNLPTILGIGATQALGVGGGVASLGIGGLLARVYESAPARNLLMRLSRTQPGSKQERESLNLIMRATAPIVNTWRENIGKAVNDNTAGALAAQEQNPQENQ